MDLLAQHGARLAEAGALPHRAHGPSPPRVILPAAHFRPASPFAKSVVVDRLIDVAELRLGEKRQTVVRITRTGKRS